MFMLDDKSTRYKIFSAGVSPEPHRNVRPACAAPAVAETPRAAADPKLTALEPLWSGLELPLIDDLNRIETELLDIVPEMARFVTWVVSELRLRQVLSDGLAVLPPILLHGPPGIGKTHLARAIANALKLPSRLVNLASSSDSRTLMGTSAGYSTGSACLALQVMARTRCFGPAIILDEIDKVVPDSRNGSWTEGLLPFLDPVSARAILDEYLMVEADLSAVSWIATANELGRIPPPLLSRFACFEMTARATRQGDDTVLKAQRSLATDLGIDSELLATLFGETSHSELYVPPGTSIREAKGVLRAVLATRFAEATWH